MNAPYYTDDTVTLWHGDCLDVLRDMPDASVDSVVTDPPYSLTFMGRDWDRHDSPGAFQRWCRLWAVECLRVLKPGGHILAFGGTRTSHRLACAVEDAGFEIRDSIAWLYGSGFPKSLDVSKAIDRQRDDRDHILAVTTAMADAAEAAGITRADVDARMGTSDMGGWWLSRLRHRCQCPTWEQWQILKPFLNMPNACGCGDYDDLDTEVWRLNGRKGTPGEAWLTAAVLRTEDRFNEPSGIVGVGQGERVAFTREVRAANTDAARTWQGWGTALKPAHEPVVVARKPLAGTVAANVLTYGTGALNVDGCRIGTTGGGNGLGSHYDRLGNTTPLVRHSEAAEPSGRWPANVVLDESQAAALDEQSGEQRDGVAVNRNRGEERPINVAGAPRRVLPIDQGYGAGGGASRFMYTAKADARERIRLDDTAHPTVKPLTLLRWLVRLVTPPGGTVLDPFAGSGTTAEACILEGFQCITIEKEPDYLPLIVQRVNRQRDPIAYTRTAGEDLGLFAFGESEGA